MGRRDVRKDIFVFIVVGGFEDGQSALGVSGGVFVWLVCGCGFCVVDGHGA